MDFLQRIIDVSLVFDGPKRHGSASERSKDEDGGEEEGIVLIPRQPLRGTLTIACDNTDGSKSTMVAAFLSQVGEHSLPVAWRHLLERLTLVPFLLDRSDADNVHGGGDGGEEHLSPPGSPSPAPPYRGSGGGASTRQGDFVFGVPAFWNDKLFAHQDDEEDDEDDEGSLHRHADVPTGRLPCRTAGEAFEVDAAGGKTVITPSASSAENAAPMRIVSTYEFEFTVPEMHSLFLGRPAALAFVLLLSPLADPSPKQGDNVGPSGATAATTATADPASPALLLRDDWLPYQRSIAMRVLSRAFVNPFDATTGGLASLYSMHTILLGCLYLPVTAKRALVCQSVTCPLSNDRLLLNLNIMNVSRSPVVLHSASLDVYSTYTTASAAGGGGGSRSGGGGDGGKRRSGSAADKRGGSCPPHHAGGSSWSSQERRALQQKLWSEQRAGPAGADMRTVDVLTKIVTVTPMVVSDDRPPFTLHAEETYSFQFIIEVLPQLCYLLNPKSLQYVYARYAEEQQRHEEKQQQQQRDDVDNGGAVAKVASTSGGGGAEAVITDCYGEPVSNEEIVSVLSATYLSYLFVYFDLVDDVNEDVVQDVADGKSGSTQVKADGLHLRHAAKWSFGAA